MSNYVWQRSLAVAETEASSYHDNARRDLIDGLESPPGRVLDIGCGTGATCAYLKARYPGAEVWGIEVNRRAADLAAKRIDHVACGKFEEIDLEGFGIAPNSLDLILCADVLEHMYDPWSVVVRLKDYLSPEGRLIISIPNLRYLPLLDDLAHGYFRYADWGVLDITHLRFFTRKELERFLFETGYEVVAWRNGFDPTLQAQYDQARRKLPATIDTGKLLLRDLSAEDLHELFSGQFFVTVKKGQPRLAGYVQPKMGCFFWKGQQTDYWNFLATHKLQEHEAKAFDAHFAAVGPPPAFEILVIHGGDEARLVRTITSASSWLYDRFRLTIVSPAEVPQSLRGNQRIGWVKVENATTPALWAEIGRLAAASEADWLMVMEAGDELTSHALPYLAEESIRNPDCLAIYVDEDSLDAAGHPDQPYLKPDFSPDYFLSFDYFGDAVAIRRPALGQIGGLRNADNNPIRGALLRLHARFGAKCFSHVSDILYHRHPLRTLSRQLQGNAIEPALLETLPHARISAGWLPGSARIDYPVSQQPAVLMIAEACDDVETMKHFIGEVFGQCRYPRVELALFAAADLPQEVADYLGAIDATAPAGLAVYANPPGLERSARVMAAIQNSAAELVLLVRPDIAPADPLWLEQMAGQALRPEVGMVAPRLVDRNGRLLGNALILGMQGFAVGMGHGEPFDAPGHFGRLLTPQNPSALAPDVVMVARSVLDAAGGLDTGLGLTAAVIDLALRIRQLGRSNLWTPHVTTVCLGQQPNILEATDQTTLLERWLPQMARDPAYNPNASRIAPFALREHPQVSRLGLPWKPLPRLMAFPADLMGCGHYRVIEPFHAARRAELIDGYLGPDHYDPLDMAVFQADTLLLQRQVTDAQIEYLRNYRRFFKLKLIFELDDLITNLPVESHHKKSMPKDIALRLRKGLELCDRFIVSTEPLKEAYRGLIDDIRVVPNRLDAGKWGTLQPQRRSGGKLRVGWAGGVSHSGDLALIADIVKATAAEVDWVFLGMCLDEIRPYVREFHAGVPTPDYPAKLASLNLDLAIAPIAENHFNDCKSNLKLLEYGILGFPVIASDFGPYRRSQDFPGITLVKNRHKDWLEALRSHIHAPDDAARRGDALREHIRQHYLLQDHLDDWVSAWFDFS